MKRIATAAAAATLSLSAVAAPAFAADADTDAPKDETVGSSQVYEQCKTREEEKAKTADKTADKAGETENTGSSSSTGTCVQELIDNPDTKGGILGLLIGVPAALVALLGVAAAATGAIPGVSLPELPGLPQ
ncbi:hypothetical protein [Corynebacterium fournieri]|uniref:hypothetical protein n=1 Tax=Corynebacterium fournieri TaxID=1852390 RepID=UPI000A2F4F97|nr:hypothetical protein [Corynebacterium fournieri]WJY98612.1 hypothetical protein CFOUR_11170 [Corynebacterium fournieri]